MNTLLYRKEWDKRQCDLWTEGKEIDVEELGINRVRANIYDMYGVLSIVQSTLHVVNPIIHVILYR